MQPGCAPPSHTPIPHIAHIPRSSHCPHSAPLASGRCVRAQGRPAAARPVPRPTVPGPPARPHQRGGPGPLLLEAGRAADAALAARAERGEQKVVSRSPRRRPSSAAAHTHMRARGWEWRWSRAGTALILPACAASPSGGTDRYYFAAVVAARTGPRTIAHHRPARRLHCRWRRRSTS